MYTFRQKWTSPTMAWIDTSQTDAIHCGQGWSLQGSMDDDFQTSRLHPKWSLHQINPDQISSDRQFSWGDRWFGLLWIDTLEREGILQPSSPAPLLLQPAPTGDFQIKVGSWEGMDGLVCGPRGMALMPQRAGLVRAGLVIVFSPDSYLFLGREPRFEVRI